MKFAVVNLGCKVNRVESDGFIASFLDAGATSDDSSSCELVIINSCTVTAEAAKKTRKAVRNALKTHPQAQVVVTGCAAAIDPAIFTDIDARVRVWTKQQVEQAAKDMRVESAVPDTPALLRIGDSFPTRVNIKIQDGCDRACTYCIVHVARGKATSMLFDQVVNEIVAYAEQGINEIVLTGINLGSYSGEQGDLVALLETVLERTDKTRFRLSSIEPKDVSPALIDLMAASHGRICRHLHVPLQSGSNKILQEMARDYDVEYFNSLVTQIYQAMPMFSLTTDVIVGFPGESETDFEYTLELAKQCRFSKMHVFPYSQREGTPAAARLDQVTAEVKNARAHILRALSEELRQTDLLQRKGTVERILIEQEGVAVTESYHHINAPSGAATGSLIEHTL